MSFFSTYLHSNLNIEKLNENINEIIITDSMLSLNHQGDAHVDESKLLQLINLKNIKISLEADRLVETNQFQQYYKKLNDYIALGINLIRVKDLGLIERLHQDYSKSSHKSKVRLILNLESAHHNVHSIKFYENKYKDSIERILISTEITLRDLSVMMKTISSKVELYALGPILLFYSPRKLLKNQINEKFQEVMEGSQYLKASATSLESPHSGFELYENQAGTLMYAPNHFCLLDMINELQNIGIEQYRVDLRSLNVEQFKTVTSQFLGTLSKTEYESFKSIYPKRVLKGLFVVNKSKVLFKKLKNKTLENVQDHVATVVEVVKNSHLVFKQETEDLLNVNDEIQVLSPDKREKIIKIKWIKNLIGEDVNSTTKDAHFLIESIPAISVKSKIRKIT